MAYLLILIIFACISLNSRYYLLLFEFLLFNTAVCPDPGVPSKGKRLDNNFQEGKTVTFKCIKDHDLVGNDTIQCKGGIWSGEVPKCRGNSNFRPLFTLDPPISVNLHIMALTTIYPYL